MGITKKLSGFWGLSTLMLFVLSILIGLAGVAFAGNLATNPSFNGNLSGWIADPSTTYDASLDATGTPGSGSAKSIFNASGNSTLLAIYQCLPGVIIPGQTYTFGGKVFIPSAQLITGGGLVTISWFSGADCTSGFISASQLLTTSTGSWIALDSASLIAPPGATTVWLTGQNRADSAGSHQVNYDDMYVDGPSAMQTTSAPTMTEWGMIILVILLGIGSIYYLRRRVAA
jgi:hypothetical protein